MLAALLANILDGLFPAPACPVGTVAGEGIPNVNDTEDACYQRNLVTAQTARITGPVPFFVVAIRDFKGAMQIGDAPEHVVGVYWMFAHNFPLLLCELARLKQYLIWYPHFANIVKQGSTPHMQYLVMAQPHDLCQLDCHFSHSQGVTLSLFVAQI